MFDFTISLPATPGAAPAESAPAGPRRAFGRGWIESTPDTHSMTGTAGSVSVLAYGRVKLEGKWLGAGDSSFAALIAAWQRDGEAVVGRLAGEFLLVIADAASGAWLAAVDRFATHRLYYSSADDRVVLGTAPVRIARAVAGTPQLEPQAVLAYAYFHVIPAPLSICSGVRRLDHGELIAGNSGGDWRVGRYWHPRFEETRPFDFAVERERFLAALRTGVAECVDGASPDDAGCFLSGGTDSSTIAGLLTRHFGAGARTFSIGFGVSGFDETRYSRLAARHFATRHTEYYLTPGDVAQALPLLASKYEQPFGNSSAVPTYFCAKIAHDAGIRRMLGGDGGDELYGGNARYAKQWVFSVWRDVPAPLRIGVVERLLFGPLAGTDVALLRKARSYIEQTRVPLPDRLQGKYNLLERFGRDSVFTADFLDRAAPFEPAQFARDVWARCEAASQINRMLAYDFKFTLADNDLPKVTRMCEAAGVEAAFPMLTHGVTEHSLALPPDQKLRRTQLRYFFKNALRGFLPDDIIHKSKHGFGLPFGAWVLEQPGLRSTVDEAVAGLAARRILRPGFVDELAQAMAGSHGAYYSGIAWIFAVLELWLREHLPDARGA